jgi:hypothetical protein
LFENWVGFTDKRRVVARRRGVVLGKMTLIYEENSNKRIITSKVHSPSPSHWNCPDLLPPRRGVLRLNSLDDPIDPFVDRRHPADRHGMKDAEKPDEDADSQDGDHGNSQNEEDKIDDEMNPPAAERDGEWREYECK